MADSLKWWEVVIQNTTLFLGLYTLVSVLVMYGYFSVFVSGEGIWVKGIKIRDILLFLPHFLGGFFGVLAFLPIFTWLFYILFSIISLIFGVFAGYFLHFAMIGTIFANLIRELHDIIAFPFLRGFFYLVFVAGFLALLRLQFLKRVIIFRAFIVIFCIGLLFGLLFLPFSTTLYKSAARLDILLSSLAIILIMPELGRIIAYFYINNRSFSKVELIFLKTSSKPVYGDSTNLFLLAAFSDFFLLLLFEEDYSAFRTIFLPTREVNMIIFAPFPQPNRQEDMV